MKRLTNFLLPVEIGMDLDDVKSVKFKFQQYGKTLTFEYPSAKAYRKGSENVVLLKWTLQDTLLFEPGRKMEMDTFITLNDSEENPWTEIVSVNMDRTLFVLEEVEE